MRYASIRKMDISNGEEIGIALFVQGCHFHCYNCFNPQTWDFSQGKEWDAETELNFLNLTKPSYIKRISFLGGEPLCPENRKTVTRLSALLKELYPNKKQWLYTGYEFNYISTFAILKTLDVVIDGQYDDSKRDVTLKWRGSKNQRVIDVQKTLNQGELTLWCE